MAGESPWQGRRVFVTGHTGFKGGWLCAWLQAMGVPGLQPTASLSFTHYDGVIAAALLGQGVAMGRRPLIDDLLREGRLVTPFGGTLATPRAYHVVLSDRARDDPAARALMQWLVREARSETATSAAHD